MHPRYILGAANSPFCWIQAWQGGIASIWRTGLVHSPSWCYKNRSAALTYVAQLIGHHPAKQKVTGLIPSQGTCLGCRFNLPGWGAYERQPINVSLSCFLSPSFFLPYPLSINKLKKKYIYLKKERIGVPNPGRWCLRVVWDADTGPGPQKLTVQISAEPATQIFFVASVCPE